MIKKIIREIKYWSQLLLIPIYGLSFLMPRNKKIWVLGSTFGNRFADNPKYLYLYLNQYHSNEINAIWISKKKEIVRLLTENGMKAYYQKSIQGIWYCLRAKVYFYDNYSKDICFLLSGNAVKINMWHGIPLKKINMDNKFDRVRHPQNTLYKLKWFLRRMSDEKPSHYILTTSENMVDIFKSAFATKKVLTSGYPRNDNLLTESIDNVLTEEEELAFTKILNKSNKNLRKIILYMPTFRESEMNFFNVIEVDTLCQFLEREGMQLCIKLHPKSKLKDIFNKIESEFITILSPDIDPYIFLKITDVLITDYSSIYFDYLLVDKPIIFFPYDLDVYLKNSRELYFNYDEFTPGIKVKFQIELENALDQILIKGIDNYINKRKQIKEFVFDNKNDIASEKIFQETYKILNI